jgi:hypothetical protein
MRNSVFKEKSGASIVLSAFLLLSALVQNSIAREEKRGAQLRVEKLNASVLQGELLAVQGEDLIIADRESYEKVVVNFDELKSIRIIKKSGFLKGVGLGLLTGGGSGMILGLAGGDDPPGWFSMTAGQKAALGALALGILGAGIGGVGGAIGGIDESIDVQQLSEREKVGILGKLQEKSRFRKENPLILADSGVRVGERIELEEAKADRPSPLPKLQPFEVRNPTTRKFPRLHITLDSGFFYAKGTENLKNIYKSWGFGDRHTYEVDFFFTSWNESQRYPVGESKKYYSIRNVKVEYSVTRKFALGFMFTELGRYKVQGYDYLKKYQAYWLPSIPSYLETRESGIFLTGEFNGQAYFLTAALMPIPDGFLSKDSLRIGGGLGLSDIHLNFIVGETVDCSKKPLSLIAFAGYDHFFSRSLSFGLSVDYKWIPFQIDSFQAVGHYNDSDGRYNEIVKSVSLDFPGQRANFGGFGFGINLGIHL